MCPPVHKSRPRATPAACLVLEVGGNWGWARLGRAAMTRRGHMECTSTVLVVGAGVAGARRSAPAARQRRGRPLLWRRVTRSAAGCRPAQSWLHHPHGRVPDPWHDEQPAGWAARAGGQQDHGVAPDAASDDRDCLADHVAVRLFFAGVVRRRSTATSCPAGA